MELKTYFAQDAAGNIISSAIVNVFLHGTTTLATGLTRADGTPLENPFAADGAGRIQFRAPDGYYDVQVSSGPGIIQTLTIQCVDYSEAKSAAQTATTKAGEASQSAVTAKNEADRAEEAADRSDVSAEQAQNALNSITGINTNFEQNSREQWRRSLAEAGLTLVIGSFEEGATVNSSTDAVWHIAVGQCYTWEGAFPKAVAAGSAPASTGGVGLGAWISVGDASLRSNLASSEDGKGDSLLCVKQPFTNSSSRTQHDKNLDRVSILDFANAAGLNIAGDGVTDCTAGIQAAANYSKSSGKAIYFPAGNYLIKNSISIPVGDHYSKNGVVFIGDGKGATRITKDTVGTINATYNAVILVDKGYNFTLKGIMLHDQTADSYGVVFTDDFSGFYADDFYTFVTHTGILCVGDFFINSITNGMFDGGQNGLYMSKSGTTNQFDGLFATGQSGYGYQLTGGYSRVGTLACDGCKGTPYHFQSFVGSVGSLGAENPDDYRQDGIVKLSLSSHVVIDKVDTIAIHLKDTASFISLAGECNLTLNELIISGGQSTGYLYDVIANSYLTLGVKMPDGFTLAGNRSEGVVFTGQHGDDVRHFKNVNMDVSWLGRYDLYGKAYSSAFPKAIHLNSYGQPRRAGDDGSVNNDYAVKPNRGDIYLENNPAVNPSAGYIILNPGSGTLQDATYASIPIRIGGTTAERPVTPPQTTMYFDTTLGKPVWYSGTGWVDATGSAA